MFWRVLLDRDGVYVTSFLGVWRPVIRIDGRKIKPGPAERTYLLDGLEEAQRRGISLQGSEVAKFIEAWARGALAVRVQEVGLFEFQTAMRIGGASGFRRIGLGIDD